MKIGNLILVLAICKIESYVLIDLTKNLYPFECGDCVTIL